MRREVRRWIGLRTGVRCLKAAAGAAAGRRVPLKVSFHITYRCNLECGYCGRREVECRELDAPGVKRLLETYRSSGCQFWTWNGGEPLLRPDIESHVAHGAVLGLRQMLVTNCTLLPRRRTVLEGLNLLEASLDGPPRVHDAVRGEASFSAVERGLELAAKAGVPAQILVVLTRQSAEHLPWLLRFAREHGAGLTIQPVAPHREKENHSVADWLLPPGRLRESARWLESERSGGGVAASRSYLATLSGDEPARDCWAGRLFFNLRPDGSEAVCCARLHEDLPADRRFDASACRDCLHAGPQEVNAAMTPMGFSRAAASALAGLPPWWSGRGAAAGRA